MEKKRERDDLVRREPIIVDKIAAHPPDFTELLLFIPRECFKVG